MDRRSPIPRFRYRPPRPTQAVGGLLLTRGQMMAGFRKRGGRPGIPTRDRWGPKTRASAIYSRPAQMADDLLLTGGEMAA